MICLNVINPPPYPPGVCGCCPKCARLEGETCGGDHAYNGKCDRGLYCVPSLSHVFISRLHTLQNDRVGVCKKSENIV